MSVALTVATDVMTVALAVATDVIVKVTHLDVCVRILPAPHCRYGLPCVPKAGAFLKQMYYICAPHCWCLRSISRTCDSVLC